MYVTFAALLKRTRIGGSGKYRDGAVMTHSQMIRGTWYNKCSQPDENRYQII